MNKLIKVYSATRLHAAGIAARKRDSFFISGVHLKSNGFHLILIELCCRCVDTPEGGWKETLFFMFKLVEQVLS